MFPPFEHWHEFFLLVGTAAAALVALLFVAASVGAGYLSFAKAAPTRTYMTPVIVHFSAVLFACAAGLVPWHSATVLALVAGGASAVGLMYSVVLSIRVLGDRLETVEFDDRLCHGIAPPVAYAIGVAAAVLFHRNSPYATAAFAVALLLLLAVNIRNAWDLTLFMVRKHTEASRPHP